MPRKHHPDAVAETHATPHAGGDLIVPVAELGPSVAELEHVDEPRFLHGSELREQVAPVAHEGQKLGGGAGAQPGGHGRMVRKTTCGINTSE